MPLFTKTVPLSLYIHLPWCVKKCPYCDFNSHQAPLEFKEAEEAYIQALMNDLEQHHSLCQGRPLHSIFFGGGTPSLFSGKAIEKILTSAQQYCTFAANIEITLEANPGTVDQSRFQDFYTAGINRLSLGIQSFQDHHLKNLGRIHHQQAAKDAIIALKKAGFKRFNVDLMHGLAQQTPDEAIEDIQQALEFSPTHLSWYQLTIEANTLFHHQPPNLPKEEVLEEIQHQGHELLESAGLKQYEVSAYAKPGEEARHNLNYWRFGDYLGLGAGAHSKITEHATGNIMRFAQSKHPRHYQLQKNHSKLQHEILSPEQIIFEFMLNALRLCQGVPSKLFTEHTGLDLELLQTPWQEAIARGLMINDPTQLVTTNLGKRFLNDVISLFLPADK